MAMRGGVVEGRVGTAAPARSEPRHPWVALALYTAAIYLLLPLAPPIGLALARTAVGRWVLGPGLTVIVATLAAVLGVVLYRRRAPGWTYPTLVAAAIVYAVAFSWLRAQRLERTHLPEYGVAAWLAWRAVAPLVPGAVPGYVAAALLGAAIGLGDELLQAVVPGRVYDIRDVAMNALGAVLGIVVLATMRASVSGGASRRR
jgi:hypothetical protein